MRIITLLIVIGYFSISLFAQDWEDITPGNISGDITAIVFTDDNTGYVTDGHVWKTTDGGTTWVQLTTPGSYVYDIFFTNVQTAYICGSDGLIAKTTDAGVTWADYSVTTIQPIYDIQFPSENVGYAACNDSYIYKTTNAGVTWTGMATSDAWHKAVYFVNNNTGFAASTNNVWKTTDAGASWANVTASGTSVSLNFFDSNTGFVSGVGYGYRRTTNGGDNWDYVSISAANYKKLYAIDFLNANDGISVGASGMTVSTTDAGTNWVASPSITTKDLLCFTYINSSLGFAAGRTGTIIKFKGNSSIGEINNQSLNSVTNYPNPFRKSTTIEYTLAKNTDVVIEIYGITGNKLDTPLHEKQTKGTHTFNYNVKGLSAGLYYCSIKTSENTITRKIELIR